MLASPTIDSAQQLDTLIKQHKVQMERMRREFSIEITRYREVIGSDRRVVKRYFQLKQQRDDALKLVRYVLSTINNDELSDDEFNEVIDNKIEQALHRLEQQAIEHDQMTVRPNGVVKMHTA